MTTLVFVESPKKAKQIEKYLGAGYKVIGTAGHIRDLPAGKAQIPAEIASEPWGYLGVNPANFRPYYIIHPDKHKLVSMIRAEAKKAERILYASDADREGEAISWHLAQVIGDKNPIRMTFTEITKEAIHKALQNTRPLDLALVQAQEARRIIDRLSGFGASRLIWKSVRPGLSAGRIQAPALTILAMREMARMRFKPANFFTLKADAQTTPRFRLTVTHMQREGVSLPLAKGSDFTPEGQLKEDAQVMMLTEEQAGKLYEYMQKRAAEITDITQSEQSVSPQPPFTTASLQQAAARIGLDVETITKVAQSLYEQGFITYIRTDSTNLSDEALHAARTQIETLYGAGELPKEPRVYATKNASAQEAHEAIRPSGSTFRTPQETGLSGDELAVYELVYKRTLACQMKNARYAKTSIKAQCGVLTLTASGRVLLEAGYTLALADDPEEHGDKEDEQSGALPDVQQGQQLDLIPLRPEVSRTTAPGRYSETSLTKLLDQSGIGRPSTLPTLLKTLTAREYAIKKGSILSMSAEGLLTSAYLTKYVHDLTEKNFTNEMENGLDAIAQGKVRPRDYLEQFWTQHLALIIENAPVKAPTLSLPHLEGVKLQATLDGPVLTYQGRSASIAPQAIPADLTMKDVQAILDGSWKAAGKRSTTAKTTSTKGASKGTSTRKSSSTSKRKTKPKD